MSRIRTTVVVEIDGIYDRDLMRDTPATAQEVIELSAEIERIGIADEVKASQTAYRFEALVEDTNLVVDDGKIEPPPGILSAERGMVNINDGLGPRPQWRAAKRSLIDAKYVEYLNGVTGVWESCRTNDIIATFVKDES